MREEKGMIEDEIVGWHQRLNGHEFKQTPGDGEGQRSLACCSPWGHKESDITEQLNYNLLFSRLFFLIDQSLPYSAFLPVIHRFTPDSPGREIP